MMQSPDKAIRRATMVAKGLAKEIGPLPTGGHPKPPHPASMIPGVHVTGMGDEHTAIPDGYADGGAVDDLARRLTTHRNVLSGMDHKAQYAAIDGIMRDVSKHHDIMPNKLHDGWVARHRQTPDDWINSNVRGMPGLRDSGRHGYATDGAVLGKQKAIHKADGSDVEPTDETGFDAWHGTPHMSVPQQTDPMQYQGAGLQFPEQESSARLALKLKRQQAVNASGAPKNPRTIIRAPIATENKKQLPDFVAGDINYDDWKTRHESILNPEEIHQSSKWYKNVQQSFMKYYPNDPALANKMMRAWLVAQQNVSPAGAMNNVLMQREQASRGVPEDQWTAGGMPNPTNAARAVLKNQLIEGGVGQKIADFVDSAEQKPVRSWMGNHPNGGEPFVVDVHTARDTGMVDEELKNHLARLGYNKNDLNKIGIDLKGSPTEAAYEDRAEFGRGLTKHLNAIKWQGRGDWTPAEVQAVGWMGMTKLTRNAEEDSESGLSRNLRRLSFETAPGAGSPWKRNTVPPLTHYLPTHSDL